jgi:hypothetical protein
MNRPQARRRSAGYELSQILLGAFVLLLFVGGLYVLTCMAFVLVAP